MIQYVRGSLGQSMHYPAQPPEHGLHDELAPEVGPDLLGGFSDASYAQDCGKSQSGIVVCWARAPILWLSFRQGLTASSTAESELTASVDSLQALDAVSGMLEELVGVPPRRYQFIDNVSAVQCMRLPSGPWRTRALRIKAKVFLDQLQSNTITIYHLAGLYMLADLCTKHLDPTRLRFLLELLHIRPPLRSGDQELLQVHPPSDGGWGESAAAEAVESGEPASPSATEPELGSAPQEVPPASPANPPDLESIKKLVTVLIALRMLQVVEAKQEEVQAEHRGSLSWVCFGTGFLVILAVGAWFGVRLEFVTDRKHVRGLRSVSTCGHVSRLQVRPIPCLLRGIIFMCVLQLSGAQQNSHVCEDVGSFMWTALSKISLEGG